MKLRDFCRMCDDRVLVSIEGSKGGVIDEFEYHWSSSEDLHGYDNYEVTEFGIHDESCIYVLIESD